MSSYDELILQIKNSNIDLKQLAFLINKSSIDTKIHNQIKEKFELVKTQILSYFRPFKRCIDFDKLIILRKRGRPSILNPSVNDLILIKDELGHTTQLPLNEVTYISIKLEEKIQRLEQKKQYNKTTYKNRGTYTQTIKVCLKNAKADPIDFKVLSLEELQEKTKELSIVNRINLLKNQKDKLETRLEKVKEQFTKKFLTKIDNKIKKLTQN